MKQIILFDIDGVIINGYHVRPELQKRWDEKLEKDLGIDREVFQKNFIYKSFIDEVIVGRRGLKNALEEFLSTVGYTGDAQAVIDYWMLKDSNLNHELLELVGIIKQNHNVGLYIATNQEHVRADYLMNNLGLSEYFEDIFHSARIGCMKQNPEYYAQVDKLLNHPQKPPIFFDDNPGIVAAANTAGWKAYEFHDCRSLYKDSFVRSILSGKSE